MIENLQNELYQLENKLAKGTKLRAKNGGRKMAQHFLQST